MYALLSIEHKPVVLEEIESMRFGESWPRGAWLVLKTLL